jgi:3-hydroxyisobutyrate dehydrogenase
MRIGVAGLGFMGSGIASRLLKTGFEVSVYNRSKRKTERFKDIATICDTPLELGKRSDIVITALTDFEALQEVVLDTNGLAHSGGKGLVIADTSTISPAQSRSIATELRGRGIEFLGVPVMGGPAAAEEGQLVPIVAGNPAVFEQVKPAIQALGKNIFYLGDTDGSANAVKLALNLNIALIASAVSEGITLVRGAGIDPAIFVRILNSTYFKTGLSERKGPKMAAGEFEPSFHLKNMLKDLELASSTALAEKLSLPQTAVAQQLFRAANNSGFSEMDYTAICAFLGKINGLVD